MTKDEIKIVEIPTETKKVIQLADGTQLNDEEWKVWISNQILEMHKAVV